MKAGWQTKPVGELCAFLNGLWTGKKPPYVTVGVFRNTDFGRDGALKDNELAVLQVEERQLAKRRLQFGDIILEKSGGGPKQAVGRVAFYDKIAGVHSFSNFTSAIRVNDANHLLPQYLLKFLLWIYLSGVTEGMQSHSTGIRNLNGNAYKQIEVPVPPFAEQRRIVAVLDKAFAAIAIATANAQANLANARALFESYANDAFEELALAVVKRPALETLTEAKSGITYGVVKPGDVGSIPFVRGGDLIGGEVRMDRLRTITDEVSAQYNRTLLRGGELLMCLVGVPGQCAIAPPELAGANIARQVGLIRLKPDLNAEYVKDYLQSPPGQKSLGTFTGGSVQQVINLGDLRQVEIPLPDRPKQDEMVKRIAIARSSSGDLAQTYEAKLANLAELKQSLLQKAFAGELT